MAEVDDSVKTSWDEVCADNSETTWALWGSPDDSNKSFTLIESGSGGLSELKGKLDDSKVQFAGFRCTAVDSAAGVGAERRSPKFVFVAWVGPNVGALKKAKASFARQAVNNAIMGVHLSVDASDADDLTEEAIEKTIIDNAGAHKPQKVEF
eukprot:TRINITY_DN8154_c0_g1_i2.p1 TRINITY_DN8154_c0_g1~~TRINITY_DN8154_c0_g1_i2.p1  ORF type:complete len:152 (-),score=53.17 TRINITY_DN8154_c0_g1_i2:210-665(-)